MIRVAALAWVVSLVAALAGCVSTGGGVSGSKGTNEQRAAAAQTNVQLAAGYVRQGRMEIALEKIQRALELNPSSAEAHSVAGVIYEQIGDFENAKQHYRRAVRLNGESGQVLNNYGQFLCRTEQYEEGIEHLLRAILDPFYETPAVALTNAGHCAGRLGQNERAEAYYRRALKLDDDYPDALIRLSQLLLNAGDAFRARAFLQRYESVAAPSPDALALGLRIECDLHNQEAVEAYAGRLKKLFPDSDQAKSLHDKAVCT